MWTFRPILKQTIWGGDRISRLENHGEAADGTGESLEISGLENCMSVVDSGEDSGLTLAALIDRYGSAILGEKNYHLYNGRFPLLIKLLDARTPLSVQVHPDDDTASRHGLDGGKAELWYVLDTTPETYIVNGFNSDTNPAQLRRLSDEGRIEEALNKVKPQRGDVYFIPGGRVHALGPGAMVVEIQQPSDCTYRLYDYGRLDKEGKPRELQLERALETADCRASEPHGERFTPRKDLPVRLISTRHFNINLLDLSNELLRDYSETDSFVVLTCVDGNAVIKSRDKALRLSKGCSVLIPASARNVLITPDGSFRALETFMP